MTFLFEFFYIVLCYIVELLNTTNVPTAKITSNMMFSNVSGASENNPPKKIEPIIIPAEHPMTIMALSGLNGIDNLITSSIHENAVRYTQRVENCACGISVIYFKIASNIVSAEIQKAVGRILLLYLR